MTIRIISENSLSVNRIKKSIKKSTPIKTGKCAVFLTGAKLFWCVAPKRHTADTAIRIILLVSIGGARANTRMTESESVTHTSWTSKTRQKCLKNHQKKPICHFLNYLLPNFCVLLPKISFVFFTIKIDNFLCIFLLQTTQSKYIPTCIHSKKKFSNCLV